MRVTFELTQQDLEDVQELLAVRRRERIYGFFQGLRTGPYWRHALVNTGLGLVAGLLLWPLAHATVGFELPLLLFAVAVAVPIATWIQRRFGVPAPRYRGLYRWTAKRQGKDAASRSVLGTVSVELGDAGIVRENASGRLVIPWSDIQLLAQRPNLLVARLRNGKIVAVPTRAFGQDTERSAFLERLREKTGRAVEDVAPL